MHFKIELAKFFSMKTTIKHLYFNVLYISGIVFLISCSDNSIKNETIQESESLFYVTFGDSLMKFDIYNNKNEYITIVPSAYGYHSIKGNHLLYCKKERIGSLDVYNMYLLNLKTKQDQSIRSGYGGKWNKKGDKFVIYKDDTLWLYSYPEIKCLNTYYHGKGWRFSGIDWNREDNKFFIHAHSLDSLGKSALLVFNSNLTLLQSISTNGIITKDIANINDSLIILPSDCLVHFNLQEREKAEKKLFTHLTKIHLTNNSYECDLKAPYPFDREQIEYIKTYQMIVYPIRNKEKIEIIGMNLISGEIKKLPIRGWLCN